MIIMFEEWRQMNYGSINHGSLFNNYFGWRFLSVFKINIQMKNLQNAHQELCINKNKFKFVLVCSKKLYLSQCAVWKNLINFLDI